MMAADDAELMTMINGVGYWISAITDEPIVMILAIILQYPNTLAAKIVGISSILAIKLILNAELIPNLAAIIRMSTVDLFSQYIIKRMEPQIPII